MAHFSTKLQCTGPVWDWPSSPAYKIFGLNVRQNWREQSEILNASIYLFNVLESVGLVPLCRMFTLIPSSITVSFQTLTLESILISYFIFKSYLYLRVEEIQAFMPLALRMISSLSLSLSNRSRLDFAAAAATAVAVVAVGVGC